MVKKVVILLCIYFINISLFAQTYPQNYFRNPLDIPMKLVANFGEIRANHWHMGLDIRTNQRVNLPVHAAADGYIARVSVEPGGFGQAIYINHPNGTTTLYGHLNAFFPTLAQYVKEQQYAQQSWRVNLNIPANMFPVKKGDFIALSGSTGASEGPHVHFEIRDTKTENCLNPLLFNFPIADAVPPTVYRIAMYDRNKSTYLQSPQMVAKGSAIKVGSNRISFAVGAADRFSNSTNPNGIYSARVLMDGTLVSEFILNNISYDDTRYINAQLDYRYKNSGGSYVQHITPLPGDRSGVYTTKDDGVITLNDAAPHTIVIEVLDANKNISRSTLTVQYNPSLAKEYITTGEKFLPNNVNVFERHDFLLFTSERTIYDTMLVSYTSVNNSATNAVSPTHTFMSSAYPAHDSVTVRIKPITNITAGDKDRLVIKNTSGTKTFVEKGVWQNGFVAAKFKQFGSYQIFIDNEPPAINEISTNLTHARSIVFTPRDNFGIKNFRAEVDGQWLRFSNDKGKAWIYLFDEKFPPGEHILKVTVEDVAGNVTTKTWTVHR